MVHGQYPAKDAYSNPLEVVATTDKCTTDFQCHAYSQSNRKLSGLDVVLSVTR